MTNMNLDALSQAKARWEEIAPLLASAQVAYHSGAAPEITDDHYDRLIHELRDIEAAHPELASQDSPTQNVGADATATGFAPVTHLERLFSLQDVFTLEDLQAWYGAMEAELPADFAVTAETKIDGLALNLRYEGGELTRCRHARRWRHGRGRHAQREDDRRGAGQASWWRLARCDGGARRVFFPLKEFAEFNAKLRETGQKEYAESAQCGCRFAAPEGFAPNRYAAAVFIAHGIGALSGVSEETGKRLASQEGVYAAFAEWGIPVSPYTELVSTWEGVEAFITKHAEDRYSLIHGIDGAVFKVNNRALAGPARIHLACAALGGGIQVPARRGGDQASGHPHAGGANWPRDPVRRHGADFSGGIYGCAGYFAQSNRGGAQGRAHRGYGDPPQGGRRDPRGGGPCGGAARRERAGVAHAARMPLVRNAYRPG